MEDHRDIHYILNNENNLDDMYVLVLAASEVEERNIIKLKSAFL